jgi:hypothetical protein
MYASRHRSAASRDYVSGKNSVSLPTGKPMRLSPGFLPVIFCSSFSLLIAFCLIGQQLQQPPSVVRSFVNEVLVPVVVRDSQGQAVGNLTRDDFQVFDNGKLQTITGFTVIKRAAESAEANSVAPSPDVSDSPGISQPISPPQRFVVLLFDDYNLSFADLAQAQQAAIKTLDSSLGPADVAAVLSTSGTNSGLTRPPCQHP